MYEPFPGNDVWNLSTNITVMFGGNRSVIDDALPADPRGGKPTTISGEMQRRRMAREGDLPLPHFSDHREFGPGGSAPRRALRLALVEARLTLKEN